MSAINEMPIVTTEEISRFRAAAMRIEKQNNRVMDFQKRLVEQIRNLGDHCGMKIQSDFNDPALFILINDMRAKFDRLTAENEAQNRRLKWNYDKAMGHLIKPIMTFEQWMAGIDEELRQ